jgi:hypothetical protein
MSSCFYHPSCRLKLRRKAGFERTYFFLQAAGCTSLGSPTSGLAGVFETKFSRELERSKQRDVDLRILSAHQVTSPWCCRTNHQLLIIVQHGDNASKQYDVYTFWSPLLFLSCQTEGLGTLNFMMRPMVIIKDHRLMISTAKETA